MGVSCSMWDLSVAAHRLFVAVRGLLSSCGTWAPEQASSVVVVCSCPAARGILVPWPGIKPASSALQDGFLTTGPPGKSLGWLVSTSVMNWYGHTWDLNTTWNFVLQTFTLSAFCHDYDLSFPLLVPQLHSQQTWLPSLFIPSCASLLISFLSYSKPHTGCFLWAASYVQAY